jgi:hypothetical protein
MGGHVGSMEENRNANKILMRTFESKILLGRSAHRCNDIKMGFKETEWKFVVSA